MHAARRDKSDCRRSPRRFNYDLLIAIIADNGVNTATWHDKNDVRGDVVKKGRLGIEFCGERGDGYIEDSYFSRNLGEFVK